MSERPKQIPIAKFTEVLGVAADEQLNRRFGLEISGPQTFTVSSSLEARLLREKRQNAAEQGEELPISLTSLPRSNRGIPANIL